MLWREHELGWLEGFPNDEMLEAKVGKAVYSKIGVIAKLKGEKLKVRLIHDLKRSGANQLVQTTERIILPRITDVVNDALEIGEDLQPEEDVEAMVLDFADAFKQLTVAPQERKYICGRTSEGSFVYKTVAFGIKSGP